MLAATHAASCRPENIPFKINVMNNKRLTGTPLRTQPEYKDAPVQKRYPAGIITYPRKRKRIYVSFPDEGQGVYSWNPLLKLKDKPENDDKALCKIRLLMDQGTRVGNLVSQEIARNNPGVSERAPAPVRPIQKLDAPMSYSR
jgi:hypothetical protein